MCQEPNQLKKACKSVLFEIITYTELKKVQSLITTARVMLWDTITILLHGANIGALFVSKVSHTIIIEILESIAADCVSCGKRHEFRESVKATEIVSWTEEPIPVLKFDIVCHETRTIVRFLDNCIVVMYSVKSSAGIT